MEDWQDEYGERQNFIRFQLGDELFESRPDNTLIFLHGEADEEFDHFYLMPDPETDEGYFVFRKSAEHFDIMVDSCRDWGYTIIEKERAADSDRDVYFKIFPVEYKPIELTMRQERRVRFLNYLLHHGKLVPEDFEVEGDLYL